jgi:hypothetical protein
VSTIIWLKFLYIDPHRHDNRDFVVIQSLFQQCDGVILVLQILCDGGKCVLRYLESIMNIISQGASNQFRGFLALSNDFIKPMLHPTYISLHLLNLLSMLTHCVHNLLNNPLQDNKSIFHFSYLRLPLGVTVIYM